MARATITIEGFASSDPETRDVTGHTITKVTIPVTPQKKNAQGDYEDNGDTIWYQAEFWDEHGQTVAETIRKGMLVTVSGGLEVKTWESNGKSGVNVNVTFPTIGVIVRKPKRDGNRATTEATTTEPWGNTPPADSVASQGESNGFAFEGDSPF